MFRKVVVITAVLTLSIVASSHPQELWTSKDGSIRNVDTRAILASGQRIYIATRNELYVSSMGPKEKWESIFFIPSSDNEITCLSSGSGYLLIGTKRGLFRSLDQGKTWRKVFKTIMPDKSSVLAIGMSGDIAEKIVIGTRLGIFVSDDGGERWRDASGALKGHRVKCIALGKGNIYAGADDGLYIAKDQAYGWDKVYGYANSEGTEESLEGQSDSTETEEAEDPGIICIALKGRRIYLACGRKISYSDDTAKGWQNLSVMGLRGSINSMLVSQRSDKLYSATTKGVFEYVPEENRWEELYKGIEKAANAKQLLFGDADEKTLWASTNRGLYKIEIGRFMENQYVDVEKNLNTLKIIIEGEPTFKELQAQAMRFNDVSPEKIKRWHSESRIRALVPKVSIGFDNSRSNTYEIYTSATKDYVISGPDDINEGMDVSVSWDLANLIWSDDQTNIDVRSRLTTQLRNDILDDLRRAYFERRRLQYEVMASPPTDMKLRFEKDLRIQELSQAIDDVTGNYLSTHAQLAQKNNK